MPTFGHSHYLKLQSVCRGHFWTPRNFLATGSRRISRESQTSAGFLREAYASRSPSIKKGQGKSIRRLALTFILKQNAEPCVSPSRHGNNHGIGNDRPCAIAELQGSHVVGKNCRLAKKIGQALTRRACPHSTGSRLEPYSPVGARQDTGNGLPDKAGFWFSYCCGGVGGAGMSSV
jgi:hypothetical protein